MLIAIDKVPAMLATAGELLGEAAGINPWFKPPVVAQNCLFNIFTPEHLRQALAEVHRVLRLRGRFVSSDPVAERPVRGVESSKPGDSKSSSLLAGR